MGETKQGLWQTVEFDGDVQGLVKQWTIDKVEGFFKRCGDVVTKETGLDMGSYDKQGVKFTSKAGGKTFTIYFGGGMSDLIIGSSSGVCRIEMSSSSHGEIQYMESDNYLFIKFNNVEPPLSSLALVNYGDYVRTYTQAASNTKYHIADFYRIDANLITTEPDLGNSTIGADELLLGNYFNNGILAENVYNASTIDIRRMMPFEVIGLGTCVHTGVGLVKL